MNRRTTAATLFASALLPALVYAWTLHPSVPAGDSGELIAAAKTLGVAHPPGYPLYTLLGHAWISAIPAGSSALRMNLFSAACAVLTVVLVARLVLGLTRSPWAALAAAYALAFAAPFWKYAVVTEVFALNALLAALLLTAFMSFLRKPRGRPLAAAAFLAALLLSHHHTLVLLALPLAVLTGIAMARPERWIAWMGRGRAAARTTYDDASGEPAPAREPARFSPGRALPAVALAAVLGLLPLLYLPIAASRNPVLNWGDPRNPGAFLRVLLRSDYGTFRLDPAQAGHIADRSHLLLYLESIPRDLTLLGAALAAVGLAVLVFRRHPLAWAILGFGALQTVFFTRVNFPSHPPVFLGVVERFYILPSVVLALAIGVGAAFVLERGARLPARVLSGAGSSRTGSGGANGNQRMTTRVISDLLGAALVAAGAAWPLGAHFGHANQRGNTFTEDLARNVLASLPEGTVLFTQGDLFHNGLAYLTLAEGERPDIDLLDQEMMTFPWFAPARRRQEADILPPLGAQDRYDGRPETGNLAWLDHWNGRRPVALIGLKEHSYAARYALPAEGFVLRAYPAGAAPGPREQARRALEIAASCRLDAYFRAYDPWSFEAESRWRLAEFVGRAAALLCHPEAFDLPPGTGDAGLRVLLDFIARNRDRAEPDRETLMLGGALLALHPRAQDGEAARADLERYLTLEPRGPRAEEARALLRMLQAP